jgi:hypothetical protein
MGKLTFTPCIVGVFCFTPCNFYFLRMPPCNVDNFVLPPLLTFLLTWHEKSHCHISKSALIRQQKGDFVDVAVTFSPPH